MSTHVTYGCVPTIEEPIVVAARKSGLNKIVSPLHAQIESDPVAAMSTHVTYSCVPTIEEPIVVAARKSCLKKLPMHVQFDLVAEEEINNHTQSQMPVQSILDEETEHAATQQNMEPIEEDEANGSTSSENESTSDCSSDSTDESDDNDDDVAAFDKEEKTAIAQRADDASNAATQSGPFNSAQLNEIYSNLDSFHN